MLGNYGSGLIIFFHIKKQKGKVTELGLLKGQSCKNWGSNKK
jgi:hypothetical protein